MASAEVRLEDVLRALRIPLLRIDRGTGHMGNHGVASAEGVLCVPERVVFGCWLWEPDVASIAAEVAALKSFCDVFLYDDGTTGGVDEP